MPLFPYFIVGDCDDDGFPIERTDEYVEKMRAAGHNVTYRRLPGMKHGMFTPEAREELTRLVLKDGFTEQR